MILSVRSCDAHVLHIERCHIKTNPEPVGGITKRWLVEVKGFPEPGV